MLDTPIARAGRAFAMYAKRLEKLNITTIGDLLLHLPARYEDFSLTTPIANAPTSETVTIRGTVANTQNTYARRNFQIQRVTLVDESGQLECVWFNQPYIVKNIHVGDTMSVSGRIERVGNRASMQVKEYEVFKNEQSDTVHTGSFVPVYPETRGVTSRWIRNRIKTLLDESSLFFTDYLPQTLLRNNHLISRDQAIKSIHFPKNQKEADIARKRLAYDELFMIQLAAVHRKTIWKNKTQTQAFEVEKFNLELEKFYNSLPFELTSAQKKAIKDIAGDMQQTTPMNRLLQGDVGSGKTIVAAVGMYLAYLNGFQSALMAPTDILATQHFVSISKILSQLGVTVSLLTSSKYKIASRDGIEELKSKNHKGSPIHHKPDIFIGTHALIHKHDLFQNLGFVVIDEQHRFGVEQRSILREMGHAPHFLTMTATPIPRTVFLTMYGDLELSVLDELPSGRLPIKTWLVPNTKRQAAYEWIKKEILTVDSIGNRNQVFIVCPFIEESESMTTVRAAIKEFEYLQKEIFPDFRLGLLHGKMKSTEKQIILEQFQKGKLDILVSTPVVEVGIDIPNATIMVIEAAERFGLASLHQLRGRVGRNSKQSYCLLFTESESQSTTQRLKALETNHNGAALAEIDLRTRGAGDMFGTQQSGARLLKIASFGDTGLIHQTQQDARKLYQDLDKYPILQETLKSTIIQRVNPD